MRSGGEAGINDEMSAHVEGEVCPLAPAAVANEQEEKEKRECE